MPRTRDASSQSQAGRRDVAPVEVVVGVIGRAHGLRGEVVVEVRTDEPELRFATGSVVGSQELSGARLTVAASRPFAAGRLLVSFVEVTDRTAAEALRGRVLTVLVDPAQRPAHHDEYYDHQLRGLRVVDQTGAERGIVSDVVHLPSQDLLEIHTEAGHRLVPFVSSLVPQVDLAAGVVTVVELPGLLADLTEEPS